MGSLAQGVTSMVAFSKVVWIGLFASLFVGCVRTTKDPLLFRESQHRATADENDVRSVSLQPVVVENETGASTHEIPITNGTHQNIVIDKVLTSCTCSKAKINDPTLLAGQSTSLTIEIRRRKERRFQVNCVLCLSSGPIWKYVLTRTSYQRIEVFDEGSSEPLRNLDLGTLSPGDVVPFCFQICLHLQEENHTGLQIPEFSVSARSDALTLEAGEVTTEARDRDVIGFVAPLRGKIRGADAMGVYSDFAEIIVDLNGKEFRTRLPIHWRVGESHASGVVSTA